MIQTPPTVQTRQKSLSKDGLSVFLLIESDSGPFEVQMVEDSDTFLELYNSTTNAKYNMALTLLSYGFILYVLRATPSSEGRIGIRKFTEDRVSYPEYGVEYESFLADGGDDAEGDTYSQIIDIQAEGGVITSGSYFMLNDSMSWNLQYITSTAGDVPVSTSMYNLWDEIVIPEYFTTISAVRDRIIDGLGSTLGYRVDVLVDEAEQLKLRVWSTHKFYSSKVSNYAELTVDENDNHDIECAFWNDDKQLDIFSKYASSIEDTQVTIAKRLDTYSVEIIKTDVDGAEISNEVFEGTLDEDGDPYIEDAVNEGSEAIEMTLYGEDIVGEYTLGRAIELEITDDDFLTSLTEIDAGDYYCDIVLDSGVDSVEYQKYLCTLFPNSMKLLRYIEGQDLTISRDKTVVFYPDVQISNIYYPAYFPFLELLGKKSFEGVVLDGYEVTEEIITTDIDDDLIVNQLQYNDFTYGISNPLGYMGVTLLTARGILCYVATINLIRYGSGPSIINTADASTLVKDSVLRISEKLNYSFDMTLVSFTKKSRKAEYLLNYSFTDPTGSEFDLTINIEV